MTAMIIRTRSTHLLTDGDVITITDSDTTDDNMVHSGGDGDGTDAMGRSGDGDSTVAGPCPNFTVSYFYRPSRVIRWHVVTLAI